MQKVEPQYFPSNGLDLAASPQVGRTEVLRQRVTSKFLCNMNYYSMVDEHGIHTSFGPSGLFRHTESLEPETRKPLSGPTRRYHLSQTHKRKKCQWTQTDSLNAALFAHSLSVDLNFLRKSDRMSCGGRH